MGSFKVSLDRMQDMFFTNSGIMKIVKNLALVEFSIQKRSVCVRERE